ncbi:MAG: hypothetical protein ACOC1P_04090 [Minisyncoccales bacterium]
MKDLIDKYRFYERETKLALDCIKESEESKMSYSYLNLAESIIDSLETNMRINNPNGRYNPVIKSLRKKLDNTLDNKLNNKKFAA